MIIRASLPLLLSITLFAISFSTDITIPWWIITMPIWLPLAVLLFIFFGALLCIAVDDVFTRRRNLKTRAKYNNR